MKTMIITCIALAVAPAFYNVASYDGSGGAFQMTSNFSEVGNILKKARQ